ncbi:GTP-binding protein [Nonomuraea polychroma]|uniref:GTP-binding protein n=1 Tax=Nonomuraea polychroma TaxID=46176 RepID=UPI003D8D2650
MSVPVVLVAGLHGTARAAVVDRLLADHPGAVVVRHEPRAGCEELVAGLRRLAQAAALLVVEVGDAGEPRVVAEAVIGGGLRLTGVLAALDARHMPIDIIRGDRLDPAPAGQGLGPHVGEVLARQIEYATCLALAGGDAEDVELAAAVLAHLAPCTPVHHLCDGLPRLTGPALCPRELAARVDPGTALLPCDAQTGAVTTVVWRRLRPLHPARLYAAAGELAACTVRGRGRFWLASRHERMLEWDAVAGQVTVRDAGLWMAALPEAAWDALDPARRAGAALDWNPIIGDRVQHLVFTGPDLDRDRIHALLDACLLTPPEALAGSAAWRAYDDPFARAYGTEAVVSR